MHIGPYQLPLPVVLAPMSGITDFPFRQLARAFGVGMSVTEMVASASHLRDSKKSTLRRLGFDEPGITAVQLLGNDPRAMAQAAQYNVDLGAKIIDINMGCPAKKVLKKQAGSALLANERLVGQILDSVVAAVDVPVTLKIRTGFDPSCKNALSIANIAHNAGVASLSIHGRTRACKFNGEAEYQTIAQVKQALEDMPIVANGDIDSLAKAQQVMELTHADGIMIGRGALGKPWFIAQLGQHFGQESSQDIGAAAQPDAAWQALTQPSIMQQCAICQWHLEMLYSHYGVTQGVRIGRKHLRWYLQDHVLDRPELTAQLKALITGTDPKRILQQLARLYAQIDSGSEIKQSIAA